ncbi:MAG: hypothetical protein EON47_03120 [Acetobacteraceae bacterium]|nr:MAG: hypothetical protein EON47_03120 [Acetobacteraceae bacterium]
MSMTSMQGRSGGMGSALLAILTVPLLLCCLGAWEIQRAGAAYADLAGQERHHLAMAQDLAPPEPGAGIPAADAAIAHSKRAVEAADADLLVARLRQAMAWLTLLAGSLAGVAGAAGMGLVARSADRGRRSRADLVVAFGRLSRVLPLVLGVQVVGGVLALAAAVAFEVGGLWFIPDPGDRTVLLAILVLICTGLFLWGAVTTLRDLRAALRALQPAPLPISAIPITEAQAPGLFALLRDIALERGTTPPEVVAVGAERSFFVTALPLLLRGGPDAVPVVTRGRTLHLALAEMATLDLEELRTVLAHELAHFSGQDTDYSLRFQPLYTRLGQGAEAMSRRRSDWGSTWVDRLFEQAVHPHTILAVHALERFSHVVAHWSRLRELEADRAAVATGSAAALASSLLRLGLAGALLRAELNHIAEQPDAATTDLAASLVARIGAVHPARGGAGAVRRLDAAVRRTHRAVAGACPAAAGTPTRPVAEDCGRDGGPAGHLALRVPAASGAGAGGAGIVLPADIGGLRAGRPPWRGAGQGGLAVAVRHRGSRHPGPRLRRALEHPAVAWADDAVPRADRGRHPIPGFRRLGTLAGCERHRRVRHAIPDGVVRPAARGAAAAADRADPTAADRHEGARRAIHGPAAAKPGSRDFPAAVAAIRRGGACARHARGREPGSGSRVRRSVGSCTCPGDPRLTGTTGCHGVTHRTAADRLPGMPEPGRRLPRLPA